MKNCKAAGDDGVSVEEKVNAAKECKAEQADPNFAASHDGKTFDEFYGTNGNPKKETSGTGKNAFGKCVSSKAKAKGEEEPPRRRSRASGTSEERAKGPREGALSRSKRHQR